MLSRCKKKKTGQTKNESSRKKGNVNHSTKQIQKRKARQARKGIRKAKKVEEGVNQSCEQIHKRKAR